MKLHRHWTPRSTRPLFTPIFSWCLILTSLQEVNNLLSSTVCFRVKNQHMLHVIHWSNQNNTLQPTPFINANRKSNYISSNQKYTDRHRIFDDRQSYRLYSSHQVPTETKLYVGICASLGMHYSGVIRKQNFRDIFQGWEQREIKNINLEWIEREKKPIKMYNGLICQNIWQ